jgi:RNA polymerase sigma factor for flagellar operon FliA
MEAGLTAYRQAAARDERERLILDHLEDVRHILGRIAVRLPRDVDRQNLESAGVLGLVEAAGQYDPQRGVDFGAFARLRIRGAILDELRRNCPLPQRMLKRLALVKQAYLRLDPPVTSAALARLTGLSQEEVEECQQAAVLIRQEPWTHDIEKKLTDDSSVDRDGAASILQHEDRTALVDAIEQLPERERLVLTLYYLEDLRLREIAEVLHLSESRVSRLLSRAEEQLRQLVSSRTGLEIDE